MDVMRKIGPPLLILIGVLAGEIVLASQSPSTLPHAINSEREETARLVKIAIFAAVVQATREVANPDQASKLLTYQLGDPSPAFDKQYPVRVLLAQKSHALPHSVKEQCLNYLLRYPYWQSVYHAYLLESFAPNPPFDPNGKRFSMSEQVYAGRSEFARLLAQIFICGGGSDGWKGLVEELSRHQLPKKCLSEIGNRLTEGLKADPQAIGSGLFRSYRSGQVAVIHNPLMAPMTGVVAFPRGWNAGPVYVVGAWSTEKGLWTCVSHEFAHPILNAIRDKSEKFRGALVKTTHCFGSVTGNRMGYDEWGSYFNVLRHHFCAFHRLNRAIKIADHVILAHDRKIIRTVFAIPPFWRNSCKERPAGVIDADVYSD
ncbi:MAG: hypothetical protein AB9903_27725 [Vulcanimicrobiota bacterium]